MKIFSIKTNHWFTWNMEFYLLTSLLMIKVCYFLIKNLLKFQLPVTPKELPHTALPQGVLQLLKSSERNAAVAESHNCEIFVGEVNIKKNNNNHVLTDM